MSKRTSIKINTCDGHMHETPPEVLQDSPVLIQDRTMYLFGEINNKMSLQVLSALEELNKEDGVINIVLNSDGGDALEALAIHDAILQSSNPVTITVRGACFSGATIILQSGQTRRVSASSLIMIHDVSIVPNVGQMSISSIETELKCTKMIQKHLARALSRVSIFTEQQIIDDFFDKDTYLTPEEAVKMGFADEVI